MVNTGRYSVLGNKELRKQEIYVSVFISLYTVFYTNEHLNWLVTLLIDYSGKPHYMVFTK